MPVELLAPGTGSATSADVTVTAAAPVTIYLKPASGAEIPNFRVTSAGVGGWDGILIQIRTTTSVVNIAQLTAQNRLMHLTAPGVYRVLRLPIDLSIGVDRSDP
jgi:hypothetical protein